MSTKDKVSKHFGKLLWKRRNPLAEGTRFRSGSGKHGKDIANQRHNEKIRVDKEARNSGGDDE